MAELLVPDSRFETPELFYPGRMPVGNVQVDWTSPFSQELEMSVLFTQAFAPINCVKNTLQQILDAADRGNPTILPVGVESADGSSQWFYEYPCKITALGDFTITVIASRPSYLARGSLFQVRGINYWSGTAILTFMQHYGDSDGSFLYINGSFPNITTAYFINNEKHTYSVSRKGTLLEWFRDGVSIGSVTTVSSTIDLHYGIRISAYNGNDEKSWNGMIESVHLHTRALNESEHMDCHNNPYGYLVPA